MTCCFGSRNEIDLGGDVGLSNGNAQRHFAPNVLGHPFEQGPALEEKIIHRIIQPTIKAMAAEGCPFTGVLFAGIMVVDEEPYLLEYNVRFGDPECQALMLRLEGDFAAQLMAAAKGDLSSIKDFAMNARQSLCVVMAAQGYPGIYKKNTVIRGLEDAEGAEPAILR